MQNFNVGDWVIYGLDIGQIKKIEGDYAVFSDGSFETSGRLVEDFRPLNLRNKRIIENMDIYYKRLDKIAGHVGFNYPRISNWFADMALKIIDNEDFEKAGYEKVNEFLQDARDHKPVIDGVQLFRPVAAQ